MVSWRALRIGVATLKNYSDSSRNDHPMVRFGLSLSLSAGMKFKNQIRVKAIKTHPTEEGGVGHRFNTVSDARVRFRRKEDK